MLIFMFDQRALNYTYLLISKTVKCYLDIGLQCDTLIWEEVHIFKSVISLLLEYIKRNY